MAPFYKIVTSSALKLDTTLLASMEKANAEELARLDERLAEAEKTEGESEISDALKARANFLTRIGDKVRRNRWESLILDPNQDIGTIGDRTRARVGEDTRTRFTDRYRSHTRSRWFFFR